MILTRLLIVALAAGLTVIAYHGFAWWQRRRLILGSGGRSGSAWRPTSSATRPVILYFRSDSCGSCQAQAHYLAQLAAEQAGRFTMRRIDTDLQPELAVQYGVMSLPTTLLLDRTGRVRHINFGLADTSRLGRQLDALDHQESMA